MPRRPPSGAGLLPFDVGPHIELEAPNSMGVAVAADVAFAVDPLKDAKRVEVGWASVG